MANLEEYNEAEVETDEFWDDEEETETDEEVEAAIPVKAATVEPVGSPTEEVTVAPTASAPPPSSILAPEVLTDEQELADLEAELASTPPGRLTTIKYLSINIQEVRDRIKEKTAFPRMLTRMAEARGNYLTAKGGDPVKSAEAAALEAESDTDRVLVREAQARIKERGVRINALLVESGEKPDDDPDVLAAFGEFEAAWTEMSDWCKARELPIPAAARDLAARFKDHREPAPTARKRGRPPGGGAPKDGKRDRPWSAGVLQAAWDAGLIPTTAEGAMNMEELNALVNSHEEIVGDLPVRNNGTRWDSAKIRCNITEIPVGTKEDPRWYYVKTEL